MVQRQRTVARLAVARLLAMCFEGDVRMGNYRLGSGEYFDERSYRWALKIKGSKYQRDILRETR